MPLSVLFALCTHCMNFPMFVHGVVECLCRLDILCKNLHWFLNWNCPMGILHSCPQQHCSETVREDKLKSNDDLFRSSRLASVLFSLILSRVSLLNRTMHIGVQGFCQSLIGRNNFFWKLCCEFLRTVKTGKCCYHMQCAPSAQICLECWFQVDIACRTQRWEHQCACPLDTHRKHCFFPGSEKILWGKLKSKNWMGYILSHTGRKCLSWFLWEFIQSVESGTLVPWNRFWSKKMLLLTIQLCSKAILFLLVSHNSHHRRFGRWVAGCWCRVGTQCRFWSSCWCWLCSRDTSHMPRCC